MTDPGDLSPKEAAFGHVGRRRNAVDPEEDSDDELNCARCGTAAEVLWNPIDGSAGPLCRDCVTDNGREAEE